MKFLPLIFAAFPFVIVADKEGLRVDDRNLHNLDLIDCSRPCWGQTAGRPCMQTNTVCHNKNAAGVCPAGTKDCEAENVDPPYHECVSCNGGVAPAYCLHDNDGSCPLVIPEDNCVPGTSRCCDPDHPDTSPCHPDADCVPSRFNGDYNYICECMDGYAGDGVNDCSGPDTKTTAIDNGYFPCDANPFTMNGRFNMDPNDEWPQFLTYYTDYCYVRLTPDLNEVRSSSIMMGPRSFTSGRDDHAFSVKFAYRIYGLNSGDADGITFVIHQDERGRQALGMEGIDLGVYDGRTTNRENAIKNALVVELDTHKNLGREDWSENRVHVMKIDNDGYFSEKTESSVEVDVRTYGNLGYVWIDYCQWDLKVYVDPFGTSGKPATPQAQVGIDMDDILADASGEFFYGFTASTWGQGDYHDIVMMTFEELGEEEGCSS